MRKEGWKGKNYLMHRQILGLTDSKIQGKHKNLNGLDNQRHNLRPATNSQNHANQGLRRNNKSGYKGVSACKGRPQTPWVGMICVNYKSIVLGRFKTAEEAARAYDVAARKYFGEFARLNFPCP